MATCDSPLGRPNSRSKTRTKAWDWQPGRPSPSTGGRSPCICKLLVSFSSHGLALGFPSLDPSTSSFPLPSPSPKSKKESWWVSHPSDCHRTFTIGGMMHDGTVIMPTRLPSMRRMVLERVGWLRALDRWLPLVNRGEELVCIWRIQKGVRTAELILFKHSRVR